MGMLSKSNGVLVKIILCLCALGDSCSQLVGLGVVWNGAVLHCGLLQKIENKKRSKKQQKDIELKLF